jgi:hypothetical protein
MVSMYELSAMDISMSNMTSFPETTQKPPDTDITLGHTSFNLTALAMATIPTVLSLGLMHRRYGSIACQLSASGTAYLATWCVQHELTYIVVA